MLQFILQIRDVDWAQRYPEIPEVCQQDICDNVLNRYNRQKQINEWKEQYSTQVEPRTSTKLLRDFKGNVIEFQKLELGKKIGQGGFGDVHFAKWAGSVVAVKKLRVQRVSKKRLQQFTDEILILCELEHPNIVKFIGACVKTPNLCIVMEYMETSLYDALHIDVDIDFNDEERQQIIKQTADGMCYLHSKGIAHCDMKSQNVLLDYDAGKSVLWAKITDFGLSMMKLETETSSSASHEVVRNLGTPRYSAPEILRGEVLDLRAMKKADIYSYSLVIYEIIYEEEPFPKLNYNQLHKQVGERGMQPSIPEGIIINDHLFKLLLDCWNRSPDKRPTAKELRDYFLNEKPIFMSRMKTPTHDTRY